MGPRFGILPEKAKITSGAASFLACFESGLGSALGLQRVGLGWVDTRTYLDPNRKSEVGSASQVARKKEQPDPCPVRSCRTRR